MVVAQFVERSLPTPEIRGLNPVIGKFYLLSTVFKKLYWKNENKEKEAGKGPFLKNTENICAGLGVRGQLPSLPPWQIRNTKYLFETFCYLLKILAILRQINFILIFSFQYTIQMTTAGSTWSSKSKIARNSIFSYKATQKPVRPTCIQALCPNSIGLGP